MSKPLLIMSEQKTSTTLLAILTSPEKGFSFSVVSEGLSDKQQQGFKSRGANSSAQDAAHLERNAP